MRVRASQKDGTLQNIVTLPGIYLAGSCLGRHFGGVCAQGVRTSLVRLRRVCLAEGKRELPTISLDRALCYFYTEKIVSVSSV